MYTFLEPGQEVIVKNNQATLNDGTLAGSVLKMHEGVRNFYEYSSLKLWEVFQLASLNPARRLSIHNNKGSIEKGKDADFIIIDKNFEVEATYIKGKCVYKK